MQWRMVGRRGRSATWTIVGDPAQSSWPDRAAAEAARAEAIGDKVVHPFHLGTNYRNSKEIYEYAAAYASSAGLEADLPEAVRRTGIAPEERKVDEFAPASARRWTSCGSRSAARSRWSARANGSPRSATGSATGRSWPRTWPAGTRPRITVLTGVETKGLEFDGIVVVDPAEIEQESSTGRAMLYVVLTRATQRLVTLVR